MNHAPVSVPRGQWQVSPWIGGEGYRKGFYVMREFGGKAEWMKNAQGKARRFMTEESARAAIKKARQP